MCHKLYQPMGNTVEAIVPERFEECLPQIVQVGSIDDGTLKVLLLLLVADLQLLQSCLTADKFF